VCALGSAVKGLVQWRQAQHKFSYLEYRGLVTRSERRASGSAQRMHIRVEQGLIPQYSMHAYQYATRPHTAVCNKASYLSMHEYQCATGPHTAVCKKASYLNMYQIYQCARRPHTSVCNKALYLWRRKWRRERACVSRSLYMR
jgi:hypothetical protein